MKQKTLIQIFVLLILAILTLFYNPLTANFEGKIIFFGVIILALIILTLFDIYKSIDDMKIRIRMFNEKIKQR